MQSNNEKIREKFEKYCADHQEVFDEGHFEFFLEHCIPKEEILERERDIWRHGYLAGQSKEDPGIAYSRLLTKLVEKDGELQK